MKQLPLLLVFIFSYLHVLSSSVESEIIHQILEEIEITNSGSEKAYLHLEIAKYAKEKRNSDLVMKHASMAKTMAQNAMSGGYVSEEFLDKMTLLRCEAISLLCTEYIVYAKVNNLHDNVIELQYLALKQLEFSKNEERLRIYKSMILMATQILEYIEVAHGNKETAFQMMYRSLQMAIDIKDSLCIAQVYRRLGDAHSYFKNTENAKDYYQKYRNVASAISDTSHMAFAMYSLGNEYVKLKQGEKALSHYNKAIELFEQIESTQALPLVIYNEALLMINDRDYNKALKYTVKALDIAREQKIKSEIIRLHKLKIRILFRLEYFDEAIEYAKQTCDSLNAINEYEEASKLSILMTDILTLQLLNKKIDSTKYDDYSDFLSIYSLKRIDYECNLDKLNEVSMISVIADGDNLNKIIEDSKLNRINLHTLYNSSSNKICDEKIDNYQLLLKNKEQHIKNNTINEKTNKENITQKLILIIAIIILLVIIIIQYRKNKIIVWEQKQLIKKQKIILESSKKNEEKLIRVNKSYDTFKEQVKEVFVSELEREISNILHLINSNQSIDKSMINARIWFMKRLIDTSGDIIHYDLTREHNFKIGTVFFDLEKLINERLQKFKPLFEEKTIVVKIINEITTKVRADNMVISNVLDNMLSVMVIYMLKNEPIIIKSAIENETALYLSMSIPVGATVSEEIRKSIFVYITSDQVKRYGVTVATGLLLRYVKFAIKAHGGTVGLTKDMQEGVELWIRIPKAFKNN